MSVYSQLERGADDVRAAACGHDFFSGRHERRAHNAGLFAATATAVALLEIADERTVFECKREHRLKRKLNRPLEVLAQMIIDLVPAVVEDFSGIENVFRIECMFDCAHHFEQLVAQLFAHVFRARDADSVLSRK